jgi:hypothetical protein
MEERRWRIVIVGIGMSVEGIGRKRKRDKGNKRYSRNSRNRQRTERATGSNEQGRRKRERWGQRSCRRLNGTL